MIVTDATSHKVSSWNRQTYQRLKLALSLNLRRQVFVAVCDDLSLRNRLASQLHHELEISSDRESFSSQSYPKLVSLNLNLSDPNPFAQIIQWLSQNPPSRRITIAPGFQILGIERLTRQPPTIQRLFLKHLRKIERHLPHLEVSLLLWLPRPWFHNIVQSAPEFWQWHTGIFEFEGEPTPLPPVGLYRPESSDNTRELEETTGSFQSDLRSIIDGNLVETGDFSFNSDGINWQNQLMGDDAVLGSAANSSILNDRQDASSTGIGNGGGGNNFAVYQLNRDDFSVGIGDSGVGDNSLVSQLNRDIFNSDISDEYNSLYLNVNKSNPIGEEKIGDDSAIDQLDEDERLTVIGDNSTISESDSFHVDGFKESVSPADAYLQLGDQYRQAIEGGDASEENLAIAIQAYELALQSLDEASSQLPNILNDLGNLYWMLSRHSHNIAHRTSYLEQGIQSYQIALTKIIAEDAPQIYAMIQNNLGAAYGDLARYQEPVESLELSIRAYQEALHYRSGETDPIKYASTQNNLGTAYWYLAQHQSPVENLHQAISAYAEALCYYITESEKMNWAMIQNNLGTAYWNLAQYEQPQMWLELAVLAYKDALSYRTHESAPAASAATENNLGTAYWHLADRCQDVPERRLEYLQDCIVAYQNAIALVEQLAENNPPVSVNFDVIATRNNLGLAHYQLATEAEFSLDGEVKSEHLAGALEQQVKSCLGATPESDAYQTALSYLIKTIRTFYQEKGINGQNFALSKVPGKLLPEILPRL
jgi:tetratricopeptide (TPR) repeat protein